MLDPRKFGLVAVLLSCTALAGCILGFTDANGYVESVEPDDTVIAVGDSITLTIVYVSLNQSPLDPIQITSTNDVAVRVGSPVNSSPNKARGAFAASVTYTVVVTGMAPGSAILTITSPGNDAGFADPVQAGIVVLEPELTATIDPPQMTLYPGQDSSFTCQIISPATGITVRKSWSLSNYAAASIDAHGNVSARAEGTTDVICAAEILSGSATARLTVLRLPGGSPPEDSIPGRYFGTGTKDLDTCPAGAFGPAFSEEAEVKLNQATGLALTGAGMNTVGPYSGLTGEWTGNGRGNKTIDGIRYTQDRTISGLWKDTRPVTFTGTVAHNVIGADGVTSFCRVKFTVTYTRDK